MKASSGVAIGIDVGAAAKGFHAVALRDGGYLAKFAAPDPRAVAAWCRAMNARAIGIDAPCRWSTTGKARAAERQLAAAGIHAFATPTQETATTRNFYRWMLAGAALYAQLEPHYPLFGGSNECSGPLCFETFPQAIACALAGEIVSARRKRIIRRELLRKAGIDTTPLTNLDLVDAALCALAATYVLAGNIKCYGDSADGFIVVPGRSAAA